jgi:polysaccharide chain length determinant protein (PEP-CTERM system associated)
MLGNRELTIDDYLAILRRRRWPILIPALLGPLVAFSVSLGLHSQYTSGTLVLVEQQKVPESYVRSVVTDALNQRLATMQEQILSRTRLQPIIEKFGLYKQDAGRVPMEDLVDRLRKAIKISAVQAMVGTRSEAGLPGFTISFTADDPRLAQQICGEITSMFMEENLRVREQRAEGTTQFLTKQLEEAKRKLDQQDARLAAFKQRYLGQLPGQEQTNMNLLMGLNTQLEAVTQLLNRTQQDKTYMESLLAQQVAAWQASQTPNNNPDALEAQLTTLQSQLVTLEARYTPDHPDVIKAKNDIAQLKKKIDETAAAAKNKPAEEVHTTKLIEPPQIQQLRNQIHVAEQTLREKSQEQERLHEQIKTYQARVQLSPVVEEQYKEVTRDYQTALDFYNELLAKKTQSEMATDLERRQQGEQFRVMDPPNLPEKASFPNRPLFAAGGLGGGLALGFSLALLLEMRDKSLRNERDVEFYLQLPTLARVPSIGEENGKKARFWKRGQSAPEQIVSRLKG